MIEVLKYHRTIAKPEKPYIFTIPKEGLVYDYRFIKEVNLISIFYIILSWHVYYGCLANFNTQIIIAIFHIQGKGKWKPWQDDVVSAPPISRDTPPNQILVTTLDSVRYLALFKLLVTHHKAVMMVGPTGTGKSSYIIVRTQYTLYTMTFF